MRKPLKTKKRVTPMGPLGKVLIQWLLGNQWKIRTNKMAKPRMPSSEAMFLCITQFIK